ncbi:thioredoxin family protein [Mycoplasma tauri]|uniref:Thioredoxin family protein n=1 Tax=Mycoplasma tauri TaxID=547987 RepID=A0A953T6F5_9MOLU|nr:thioredoxin family protein [Mycoplasma tauri]MBZ4195121.1 thioredoxin family protein [Mycoplasma tauri]MBZ4203942.1 thioredoxin family protein [Mycoplasma tauri]MBZ4204254.1 thioredoxin family protein [Mycoplasma tauri]MBZ4212396.1 thioredoxin family protein [Mycoplasma tauri]MBZ4218177.1 thioredoxin family protein [Mycoplasma tauri]
MKKLKWADALSMIESQSNSSKVYFIFFSIQDDLNCKLMKSMITDIEASYNSIKDVSFYEIDAKESDVYLVPNTRYELLEVPTFCVIKNNELLNVGHNFYPKEVLINWLNEALN